eukprot:TRINITY_DN3928_c0_g1_i6.p1 TRINITY_DN3928_c0_g1~~TRINITY_DN3928_c0_g1_i6.p1  ORF type:complete len:234 (-),score=37.75 TRINITY_DN3928_c0_g1_i6:38-739(-)
MIHANHCLKNDLTPDQQHTVNHGVVKVVIYSDTMCPWCFVGKRNFEKAAQSFPQVRFEVEWHPFLLNTSIPKEGLTLSDYFRKNYGRVINVNDIFQHLKAAGQRCGIDFKQTEKVFPTIDSHRLIDYSKQKQKHEEVVELLFKEHFENSKALNDIDMLLEVAEKVGLDVEETKEYLTSQNGVRSVLEQDYKFKSTNAVRGVPYFIFSNSLGKQSTLSGAQPPEQIRSTIRNLL